MPNIPLLVSAVVKVSEVENDILKVAIIENLKEVTRYTEAPDLDIGGVDLSPDLSWDETMNAPLTRPAAYPSPTDSIPNAATKRAARRQRDRLALESNPNYGNVSGG